MAMPPKNIHNSFPPSQLARLPDRDTYYSYLLLRILIKLIARTLYTLEKLRSKLEKLRKI